MYVQNKYNLHTKKQKGVLQGKATERMDERWRRLGRLYYLKEKKEGSVCYLTHEGYRKALATT